MERQLRAGILCAVAELPLDEGDLMGESVSLHFRCCWRWVSMVSKCQLSDFENQRRSWAKRAGDPQR